MSLQVIFLGTAASIPTPTRSLPAIMIRREGDLILFDCGEGTQRQMIKARLGFNRRMKILITHMHGDHMLGLPGLIQTMSLLGRERELEIYGPPGLNDFLEAIRRTVQFTLTFPIKLAEIREAGAVFKGKEFEIHAAKADHIEYAFAYSFEEEKRLGKFYPKRARELQIPEGTLWSKLQHGSSVTLSNGTVVDPSEVVGPPRPGRKIVYTGDSRHSLSIMKLARDADVLIHECTFDDELADRAKEDGHSTASQAAKTARKAEAKRLVLTHISSRYKDTELLLKQAKKHFSSVEVAQDFMTIRLPLS